MWHPLIGAVVATPMGLMPVTINDPHMPQGYPTEEVCLSRAKVMEEATKILFIVHDSVVTCVEKKEGQPA